jgi:two-component system, OmpR family, sensor kinase
MLAAWQNLSLRLRLTLLYVGLLLVLLVGLGSFLYFDTRDFLISSTMLRVQSQAQPGVDRLYRLNGPRFNPPGAPAGGSAASGGPSPNPPSLSEIANFLAESQTSPGTTATVFGPDGNLLADGRTLPEQPLSAPPNHALIARALSGEQGLYYTTNFSGQHTLVILIPLRGLGSTGTVGGVLQLSTRLDLVDQVLARQQLLIVGGALITLILGTLGGLALTGSALAPLQWMITTCRRIAEGDLSQRVNLPHRRDEIGQLASSFDEMVERLEETFAAQRQFIGDASHELRTPLTALAGSLDVLLLAPEGDPQLMHRMLTGMRRELQRLTRLVNDLLTLNRLDAHQGFRLQTLDLAALAGEVVEQIKPIAGARRIHVETAGDTRVQGDADRLKQVMVNLLDNAIRFTDAERGVIRVSVHQAEKDVRLTVSDNGSGIPLETQPHLFERFFRVDKARARASGGSGLGLTIVKAIVEAHGGAMGAIKSAPGQGSAFELSLPRDRTSAKPGGDEGAGARVQAKKLDQP